VRLETPLAKLFDTPFPHNPFLLRGRRCAEEMPTQGVGILDMLKSYPMACCRIGATVGESKTVAKSVSLFL
jgi:hypothetical protein